MNIKLTEKHMELFLMVRDMVLMGISGALKSFMEIAAEFERHCPFNYTPLPGSEKCIREPWRNAAAMLISLHGEKGLELAKAIFTEKALEIEILKRMIEKNINTVQAGTCGRLFDAVSAICGVTKVSSYDGEAAIQLAELVDEHIIYKPYPFNLLERDILTIDFSTMIEEIALDVLAGKRHC